MDKTETSEELESKFCETLNYIFGYRQDGLSLNIPLDRAKAIIGAHEYEVCKAARADERQKAAKRVSIKEQPPKDLVEEANAVCSEPYDVAPISWAFNFLMPIMAEPEEGS